MDEDDKVLQITSSVPFNDVDGPWRLPDQITITIPNHGWYSQGIVALNSFDSNEQMVEDWCNFGHFYEFVRRTAQYRPNPLAGTYAVDLDLTGPLMNWATETGQW